MVSEPLLWPFLSSLVFIGVTPFSTSLPPSQQPPQPFAVEPSTSTSRRLWVPDLQPPLLRSFTPQRPLPIASPPQYCSDYVGEGTTEILLHRSTHSWKSHHHRSLHALSRTTKRFCALAHALHAPSKIITRLHALPRVGCVLHVPPCAYTRQISPADIILTSSSSSLLLMSSVDFNEGWPLTFC